MSLNCGTKTLVRTAFSIMAALWHSALKEPAYQPQNLTLSVAIETLMQENNTLKLPQMSN